MLIVFSLGWRSISFLFSISSAINFIIFIITKKENPLKFLLVLILLIFSYSCFVVVLPSLFAGRVSFAS